MQLDRDRAAHFEDRLKATSAEIARAKILILNALAAGPQELEDLRAVLVDAEGLERHPSKAEKVNMPWPDDPEWRPDPSHPAIARVRLSDAAEQALEQLSAAGVLSELEQLANNYVTVSIQRGGSGFGHRVPRAGPRLAPAYRLDSGVDDGSLAILDADIFSEDLTALALDPRTQRCLEEALAAYRRGLYLACASLLGAVSEGAWYSIGEQLRTETGALARALDAGQIARVIELTAQKLRQVPGARKAEVREVEALAVYLRDMRNYGVHPRSASDTSLEHSFTDHGTGLLVLQVHRYLTRLARPLSARVR